MSQPLALLRPFADRLAITLLTKEDHVQTDQEIAAKLSVDQVVSLWQVHGNRTIIVRSPTSREEQADGLITDAKDLTLTIRSADCQTFLVYAPDQNVVGLLHVGWRGMVAETIPAFFDVLKKEWNIDPDQTFVAAGPSLCQKCAEFSDPKTELPNVPEKFVDDRHVDLQGAADDQLFKIGVKKDRLERSADCTKCQSDFYWTYRGDDREEVRDGFTNVLCCQILL